MLLLLIVYPHFLRPFASQPLNFYFGTLNFSLTRLNNCWIRSIQVFFITPKTIAFCGIISSTTKCTFKSWILELFCYQSDGKIFWRKQSFSQRNEKLKLKFFVFRKYASHALILLTMQFRMEEKKCKANFNTFQLQYFCKKIKKSVISVKTNYYL